MSTFLATFFCLFAFQLINTLGISQENASFKTIQNRASLVSQALLESGRYNYSEVKMIPDQEISHIRNNTFLRVCYYRWERESPSSLMPEMIDPNLCTHILFAFADVKNSTLIPGNPSDIVGYKRIMKLKQKNPNLRIMLSVGGGGGPTSEISTAVQTETNRYKFISSIVSLLRTYGFDGLDIDWEFPSWNGGPQNDKRNFVQFLQDFKLTVLREAAIRNNDPLLLSTAVAAVKPIIKKSYAIRQMAMYVDFINLMSYDYHDYRWYMPFTAHNSPLYKRRIERAYFATLNTAWSAEYWVSKGTPPEKLLIGLPTYGHTYKLLSKYLHGFDAPATGKGMGGGDISYPDVCKFLKQGGTRVFDEESKVPYAYKDLDWIGYDDYDSIRLKAKWVAEHQYGGIMTFDLNCDDWNATCDGKTTFPLHRIMQSVLSGYH